MKKLGVLCIVGLLVSLLGACAPMAQQGDGYDHSRYNTQKGAVAGAVAGAIAGQAIGHDTESTLAGAAILGVLGALGGNAVDQSHDAARDQIRSQSQYDIVPLSPREESYQREMLRLQRNAELKAAREAERARREALRIQEAQGRQQAQEDYRQIYEN